MDDQEAMRLGREWAKLIDRFPGKVNGYGIVIFSDTEVEFTFCPSPDNKFFAQILRTLLAKIEAEEAEKN